MSFLEDSVTIFSHFLKQYCRTGSKEKTSTERKEREEKEKEKKKPSGCNGSLNPI